MRYSCTRRVMAEAIGTGFLLAAATGAGIMGARLSGGNDALILLPGAIATGGVLYVMIKALGEVSGAHFNPAVTLAFLLRREIGSTEAALYMVAQILAGIVAVWSVHVTFSEPLFQIGSADRSGFPLMLEELITTAGLVGAILATARRGADVVAGVVGVYVMVAIWATSSTAFINPAITIARMFTDSPTGIAPASVPGFLVAQLIGAAVAAYVLGWLLKTEEGDGK